MFNRDMNGIDLSDQMRLSRSNTETIGREKKPYMKFFWGLIDLVISQGCLFCREFAPKNYTDYEYRGCLQQKSIILPFLIIYLQLLNLQNPNVLTASIYLPPKEQKEQLNTLLARE